MPSAPPYTEWQPTWPARPTTIVLTFIEIETDEGVTGLGGPVSHDVATLLHIGYRKFLIGQDPLATEWLWDIMYRLGVHGRKGTTMFAISAIDCRPLGPARQIRQPAGLSPARRHPRDHPAYASMLGHSLEPESWSNGPRPCRPGVHRPEVVPAPGPGRRARGRAKNVELMEILRSTVGPDQTS